jgi:hypothetical protein
LADLFRVLEVFKEGIGPPDDALVDVGSGVREAIYLARFAAKET